MLVIPQLSGFCQALSLTPKIYDGLYCFDSTQVRFVAKEVYQSPIKDSIISGQKTVIKTLEKTVKNKDIIIHKKDEIIESDSVIIGNLTEIVDIEKKDGNLRVKNEKQKSKKIKIILLVETIIIILFVIK